MLNFHVIIFSVYVHTAKPENANEQTVGHQVPMNSSSSKENSVTKKMTLSMKRGNDVSSSSDSEEEDDTLSKTGHVEGEIMQVFMFTIFMYM